MKNYYNNADLDKAVELASLIEDSYSETDVKEILVDTGFSLETSNQALKNLNELKQKTINEQKVIKPAYIKSPAQENYTLITKEFKGWILDFLLSLCPIIIFTLAILTFAAYLDTINQSFYNISFLDILSEWVFKLINFAQKIILLCFPILIGLALFTGSIVKNTVFISLGTIFSYFCFELFRNILSYLILFLPQLVSEVIYLNQ